MPLATADQPHAVVFLSGAGKPRICLPDLDTEPMHESYAIYPNREIAEGWLHRWSGEALYFVMPAAAIFDIEEVRPVISYNITPKFS